MFFAQDIGQENREESMGNMKRKIITVLCAIVFFAMAGCGDTGNRTDDTTAEVEDKTAAGDTGSETAPSSETAAVPATGQGEDTAEGKILVAYFSWADNAVLENDTDAVSSPSVFPPGNVQQLAGWVQEEICFQSRSRILIPATGMNACPGPIRNEEKMPGRNLSRM